MSVDDVNRDLAMTDLVDQQKRIADALERIASLMEMAIEVTGLPVEIVEGKR